jgi:hypothetical protein
MRSGPNGSERRVCRELIFCHFHEGGSPVISIPQSAFCISATPNTELLYSELFYTLRHSELLLMPLCLMPYAFVPLCLCAFCLLPFAYSPIHLFTYFIPHFNRSERLAPLLQTFLNISPHFSLCFSAMPSAPPQKKRQGHCRPCPSIIKPFMTCLFYYI